MADSLDNSNTSSTSINSFVSYDGNYCNTCGIYYYGGTHFCHTYWMTPSVWYNPPVCSHCYCQKDKDRTEETGVKHRRCCKCSDIKAKKLVTDPGCNCCDKK